MSAASSWLALLNTRPRPSVSAFPCFSRCSPLPRRRHASRPASSSCLTTWWVDQHHLIADDEALTGAARFPAKKVDTITTTSIKWCRTQHNPPRAQRLFLKFRDGSRPVARKMPVGGSAPDTDALNSHPLLHWGSGSITPGKNIEILCAKSWNFVHTCTVLQCVTGSVLLNAVEITW